MGAQLALFPKTSKTTSNVAGTSFRSMEAIDHELLNRTYAFVQRLSALYCKLKANREYVIFTKSVFKASGSFGANRIEVLQAIEKRNFSAKMEMAKSELVEIRSWLDLLQKGALLKGNYRVYFKEVSFLITEVSQVLSAMRK